MLVKHTHISVLTSVISQEIIHHVDTHYVINILNWNIAALYQVHLLVTQDKKQIQIELVVLELNAMKVLKDVNGDIQLGLEFLKY